MWTISLGWIFLCLQVTSCVSQPGFIYIFAFKKRENLHFYKPTFDSSGWQGSEVNEEECVAVLENKRNHLRRETVYFV